jgi:hypothetical protein
MHDGKRAQKKEEQISLGSLFHEKAIQEKEEQNTKASVLFSLITYQQKHLFIVQ